MRWIMGTIKLYAAVVMIVIIASAAYGIVLVDDVVKHPSRYNRIGLAILLIALALILV